MKELFKSKIEIEEFY